MFKLFTAVFILLFGLTRQADVFDNPIQLTKDGSHSFPRFSADNRYVYYTATGGSYGKECEEVYRLDLKYRDQLDNPARISRVSSGIGYASSASTSFDPKSNEVYFESDFETELIKNGQKPITETQHFCPDRKCKEGSALPECASPFEEKILGSSIYKGPSVTRKQVTNADTSLNYSPFSDESFVAYFKDCKVADMSSTCLMFSDDQKAQSKDTKPVYYDHFSTAKIDGNSKYVYQQINYAAKVDSYPVFPLSGIKFVSGAIDSDTITDEYILDKCETTAGKIARWPRLYKNGDKSGILFTSQSTTGDKSALKHCVKGGGTADPTVDPISDVDVDTVQADISSNGKQIVFARRSSTDEDYQIYIANIGKNISPPPRFDSKPLTKVDKDANKYIKIDNSYEFEGQLGHIRVDSVSANLFYEYILPGTGPKCRQVYHVDLKADDFSSPRLISTGLGRVDSFDFYDNDKKERKIVYSSDFTKPPPKDESNSNRCDLVGCDDQSANDEVKTFCKGKLVKHLGQNYDIYISNIYGNIEQRLTNNADTYYGEVAFQQETSRIFYTKSDGSSVVIAYVALEDLKKEVIVTDKLPKGYYGGISFFDKDTILYHSSRPTSAKEVETFSKFLKDYRLVDMSKLGIYKYNIKTKEETVIFNSTMGQESNQHPIYNNKDGMYLFETYTSKDSFKTSKIYRSRGRTPKLSLDATPKNPKFASFASTDLTQLVLVGDGEKGSSNTLYLATYDIGQPITTGAPSTSRLSTITSLLTTLKTTPKILNTTSGTIGHQIANLSLFSCFLIILCVI